MRFVIKCAPLHCGIEDVQGGGGALIYKPLETVQHSEICSQPLNFSWFIINCTPDTTLRVEEVRGGGET